jgi:hypothetical protein
MHEVHRVRGTLRKPRASRHPSLQPSPRKQGEGAHRDRGNFLTLFHRAQAPFFATNLKAGGLALFGLAIVYLI